MLLPLSYFMNRRKKVYGLANSLTKEVECQREDLEPGIDEI